MVIELASTTMLREIGLELELTVDIDLTLVIQSIIAHKTIAAANNWSTTDSKIIVEATEAYEP